MPTMTGQSSNIRTLYASAERLRGSLDASWAPNSPAFQDDLRAALAAYEECRSLADHLALFSPNETVEDVATNDLQLAQSLSLHLEMPS